MKLSIIICTSNRAQSLDETLKALDEVEVPSHLRCELLVVDNASTDNTEAVVEAASLSQMPIRYVFEPKRGQCHARNTGMAQARGDIFLFTDDDVRPPRHWIEGMCKPILSKEAHAVAGGVEIAPHLKRPWMNPNSRSRLASTELLDPITPDRMIGANMAFAREILSKVPEFDTELGPGALGFDDETLFTWQMMKAGYRVIPALDVVVEHHFDKSRLLRKFFLEGAQKFGRSAAYVSHHWLHGSFNFSRLRIFKHSLHLLGLRLWNWRQLRAVEGCPEWEFHLVEKIYFHKQNLIEVKRSRNYTKFGLIKINHVEKQI